ncbi:MAG TPA: protein-export chaperone SecB [Gammaproteobacteria bacterium]
MADQQDQVTPTKQLLLQKIYVKDLSFESPKSPEIFTTNAAAQTQLNIRSANRDVGNGNIEVTLTMTLESKDKEETLFLVEIVQAGIFLMQGYSQQERGALLGSFCPATLYPFAREAICDVVTKGGFPQLLLQPINFDALYAQAVKGRPEQTPATPEQSPTGGPH